MLYDLVHTRGEKEIVYMTDTFTKVRSRMKQLRESQKGVKTNYLIRPAAEDADKYRRPPNMSFDPSGDAGTKKHIRRKAKAKRIKKRNPKE